MNIFITALHEAHAVFTAHRDGATTLGEIAHRTGLTLTESAYWTRAFKLRLTQPLPPKMARALADTAHIPFNL